MLYRELAAVRDRELRRELRYRARMMSLHFGWILICATFLVILLCIQIRYRLETALQVMLKDEYVQVGRYVVAAILGAGATLLVVYIAELISLEKTRNWLRKELRRHGIIVCEHCGHDLHEFICKGNYNEIRCPRCGVQVKWRDGCKREGNEDMPGAS